MMPSPNEQEGQGRKALVARSVLQQNREFFDQFFNRRLVKNRDEIDAAKRRNQLGPLVRGHKRTTFTL